MIGFHLNNFVKYIEYSKLCHYTQTPVELNTIFMNIKHLLTVKIKKEALTLIELQIFFSGKVKNGI